MCWRRSVKATATVEANREYVERMLGFEVWSHALYTAVEAHPHEHEHAHKH
jgi:hypothetical protein